MSRIITLLNLKNKWTRLAPFGLLLLLLFAGVEESKATHMAGGDIQYKCVGFRKWNVILTLYRFCDGAQLCSNLSCQMSMTATPSPKINAGGLNPNACVANPADVTFSLFLTKVEDVGKGNVARCGQQAKNSCDNLGQVTPGPYKPAIEKYTFEGIFDMSSSIFNNVCPYWDFVYSYCCRNSTVNVTGQPNFTFQATINIHDRSGSPCQNNSPELRNEPVAIFCAGQEYVFNMGAVDPDRDSLTYQIIKSLQAANTPVPYTPPYSEYLPFPLNKTFAPHSQYTWAARLVLDTATGDIGLNALNNGQAPIAGDVSVRIFQWSYDEDPVTGVRTPKIVGITMRNLQIYNIPCGGNNPPNFQTSPSLANNKPKFNWSVCAGEQLCFTITAKDTDFKPNLTPPRIDTTYLSWNNAIERPGKVFFKPDYDVNLPRPREDRYQFCWQTEESDGSTLPYYFTVQAEDNFCPNPGRMIRSFSITVLAAPKADIVKTNLNCGKWAVTMRKTDIRQSLSFARMEIANAPYDYAFTNGSRVVNAINNNPPGSGLEPRPLVSDTVQFKLGGKYLIRYTVRTPGIEVGTYCEKSRFDTIIVDTAVQAFAHDTFACKYQSTLILGEAKWGTPPYTYRWYRHNTNGTPINGPNFQLNNNYTANDTVATKYILWVQDLKQCTSIDSTVLEVKPLPKPKYSLDSLRICSYDSLVIDAGDNGGNIRSYTWFNGTTLLSGEEGQKIVRRDSGQYIQIMTDTFGCKQRDTFKLYVNLPVVAYAGLDTSVCPGDTVTLKGTGGYRYKWDRIQGITTVTIKAKNNVDSVRVAPFANTDYILTSYWAYPDTVKAYKECFHTDTVRVNARQRPILTRPDMSNICSSTDTLILPAFLITPASQQNGVGKWSYRAAPGAVIESNPFNLLLIDSLANHPRDTFYLAINTNPTTGATRDYWVKYSYRGPIAEGACLREDSTLVRVYALPKVDAGALVNLCTTNGVYPISAANGHLYSPKTALAGNPLGVWSVINGGGLVSAGANPVTYTFNPNPSVAGALIHPQINKLKYAYRLEYTTGSGGSKLGCENSDTVDFIVRQPPTLSIGVPNKQVTVCKNEPEFDLTVKAQATSTSSVPGSTKWYYALNSGIGNISAAIRDSLYFNATHTSVAAPGTWKLYYRDLASGCEVKDSLTLNVAPIPAVDITTTKDSVCKTSAPVLLTVTPTGGTMSGPALLPSDEFNVSDPLVLPDARYMFTYEFTSTAGCKNADTTYIYVQKPPVVNVSTVPPKCDYDSLSPFQLSASIDPVSPPGRYGLIWTSDGTGSFDNNTSASPAYTFTTADALTKKVIATVTSTNNGYCNASSENVVLDINPTPNATILADSLQGCEPLTVYLAAQGAGVDNSTYAWYIRDMNTVESTDSSFSKKLVNWGTYQVRLLVTTPAQCKNSSDTFIYVRAIPRAACSSDPPFTTIVKPFFNFNNQSFVADGNKLSYVWNFGADPQKPGDTTSRIATDANPQNIEFMADTGSIMIKLRAISKYNGYECTHDTVCYVQIAPDITVFIPSAFRPIDGGNGIPCADPTFSDCNDVFRVYADGFATIEIFIFNRWGQQVFNNNNPDIGWNGKVFNNGELCPQDVYIYQVNATSFSGKKYTYSGSVTLLR